jgi:hypothetical protein
MGAHLSTESVFESATRIAHAADLTLLASGGDWVSYGGMAYKDSYSERLESAEEGTAHLHTDVFEPRASLHVQIDEREDGGFERASVYVCDEEGGKTLATSVDEHFCPHAPGGTEGVIHDLMDVAHYDGVDGVLHALRTWPRGEAALEQDV